MEELKYLRQIYKVQLKDQTIKSSENHLVEQPDKKHFRGVAGDNENKGELFGLANLLKYRDGTFMNYQSTMERASSKTDQIGFKDMEAAVVRSMNEDDGNVFDDLPIEAMDAIVHANSEVGS
jgi:hypothetical protein